jgi:hypothetical protein
MIEKIYLDKELLQSIKNQTKDRPKFMSWWNGEDRSGPEYRDYFDVCAYSRSEKKEASLTNDTNRKNR